LVALVSLDEALVSLDEAPLHAASPTAVTAEARSRSSERKRVIPIYEDTLSRTAKFREASSHGLPRKGSTSASRNERCN
jgi:hypothetical protein